MNITFNQLRIFEKVAELKSVTKASEALFLTQPAVSIQLKKLEEQFDIPLFELVGRQIYITPFGESVLQSAQTILRETDNLKDKTLQFKGILSGKLKITIVSTAKYIMPYLLSDYMNKYSGIELSMDVTNRGSVIDHLKNNEVDFALISVMPSEVELEEFQLMDNELYLVGKSNPFPNQKNVKKSQLENLPLIFREKGSATRAAMTNFLKDQNIEVHKSLQLTSNEAVKQAVRAGLGYSIMPKIGITNAIKTKALEIIPYPGLPIKTKWRLVWLKNKQLSLTATRLLEELKQNKEKILAKQFM